MNLIDQTKATRRSVLRAGHARCRDGVAAVCLCRGQARDGHLAGRVAGRLGDDRRQVPARGTVAPIVTELPCDPAGQVPIAGLSSAKANRGNAVAATSVPPALSTERRVALV